MASSAPATEKKSSWWPVVILLIVIALMLAIAYFIKLTRSYYDQIQSGTINLSSFSQPGLFTQASDLPEQNVEHVDLIINNFDDDPSIGPEDAPLTIVAFEDFQCPFCGQQFPILQTVLRKYSTKVRFVYRDFPVAELHPQAQKAAEAGQCAHEQGQFWPYHDKLYTNQEQLAVSDLKRYAADLHLDTSKFDNCLDSGKYEEEVTADFSDGLKAGVAGTPTFFMNGNRLAGVITEAGFDQIVAYFAP